MYPKIKIFSMIILASVFTTSAEASNEKIQQMIQQGTFKEALVLAEEQLAKNPDEVQTLFLKGLILARMDRLKESATVFVGLTEEHPELPEPYNNLAVIYAATGDYDKAAEALRQAINTHPSYATAHENLGDIYAKLASQAYNNALKIDSSNEETKEKLSMISHLIAAPKPIIAAKEIKVLHPTSESLAHIDLKPEIVNNKEEVKSEPLLVTKEIKSEPLVEAVVDKPKVVSKPTIVATNEKDNIPSESTSSTLESKPTNISTASFNKVAVREAVQTAVYSWANAWSAKDVDSYVRSYSSKFVPPDKLSRSQWEAQRRVRLNKPKFIRVAVDKINIEILNKELALARFIQIYQSDNYKDQVNKKLLLNNIDGVWLISKEESN